MAIFKITDADGDGFDICESDRRGTLRLALQPDSIWTRLERGDVRNLRDALNRWLDEQQRNDPNPAGRRAPAEPPYTSLVRRLVAEEVARVLPLHQSPQAAVHEYATNTGLGLCTDTACTYPFDHSAESHAEHDPEPQAVGHPEAPAVDWSDKLFGRAEYPEGLKFDYCTGCGHSWGAHGDWGTGKHQCDSQLGKDRCGCTRRRGAADECTCTHKMTYAHSSKYGCTLAGCKCTWKRSTS